MLAHFRKGGPGWQSRINAALRKAAKLPEKARRKI
ncbi:MAG: BrnA antitoxin family protein [Pseudorhodoplanes sp.]|nr:BrnA antitoxin family protein [Pseudorhodoplanes sp.]